MNQPISRDAAETAASKARRDAWEAYRANQRAQFERAQAETARLERSRVQPSSIVLLALCIGGCGVCIALALATAQIVGRLGKAEAALVQIAKTESCAAPAKDGDSAIITVRHSGERLLTRCSIITDWRSPERAKP